MNEFSSIDQVLFEKTNNKTDVDIKSIRSDIRKLIYRVLQTPEDTKKSLADVIDDIEAHARPSEKRDLAMFFLRLLCAEDILPTRTPENRLDARLCKLFSGTMTDLYKKYSVEKTWQNYEVINHLIAFDKDLFDKLSPLAAERKTLRDFSSSRHDLQKRMSDS